MPYALTVSAAGPWKLEGWFFTLAKSPISPVEVRDKPMAFLSITRDAHHEEATFTCERAGKWSIIYVGTAFVVYEAKPVGAEGDIALPQFDSASRSLRLFAEAEGSCGDTVAETPTVIATSTQTPLETPVPTQTETAPTETPTETPTPNRAPLVSAISATTALPVTTYVIQVSDPDGDALTIIWSGTNCGSASGSATATMKWSHGSDDCPHDTVEHADATITVVVSDAEWRVTCSYGGAAMGTGEACAAPVRSP